jgi:hypothetical protein
MSTALAGAVHLVLGDSAGGTLRELGAGEVLVERDLVTVGRSDFDPTRHRAFRMAQWKIDDAECAAGLIGLEEFSRALPASDAPLVVWTTRTWSDQLFTWSTLERLARLGVDANRVWLAQPETAGDPVSMGAIGDARLRDAFSKATPMASTAFTEATALWRKYTVASPLAFDDARRAGSPAFPALALVAEGHGAWFPWRAAGRLRLSYADQLLFECLGNDWPKKGLADQLLNGPRGRELLARVFAWIGDSSAISRLEAWSAHGGIERRDQEGHGWGAFSFRLTDLGRRLRDEGTTDVRELAPLYVGGCLINDPNAPFVREGDASSWRLAAL